MAPRPSGSFSDFIEFGEFCRVLKLYPEDILRNPRVILNYFIIFIIIIIIILFYFILIEGPAKIFVYLLSRSESN